MKNLSWGERKDLIYDVIGIVLSSYSQTILGNRYNHYFLKKKKTKNHCSWIICQGLYSRVGDSNPVLLTLRMCSYYPIAHFQMLKKTIINIIMFIYFNKGCGNQRKRTCFSIPKQKNWLSCFTLCRDYLQYPKSIT